MSRIGVRNLSSSSLRAAAPTRGKVQGFAKKVTGAKTTGKRVSAGSLYKPWQQTVATTKLNKNAFPVEVPIFKPSEISQCVDQVMSFSNAHYKYLYTLGSFKQNQFNELFPRPIAMVRRDTTEKLFNLLKNSPDRKFILTGESGIGKSVLLSQVHSLAFEEKALVINISYPELFLDGTNDFFHDGVSYVQPMYLKRLLEKILKANDRGLLSSIPISGNYKFANADPKDSASRKFVQITSGKSTLLDLLSIKTSPRNRGDLFQAVIQELSKQTKVPVVFTVDNFSRIISEPNSAYKNANNERIHVLDLLLGKTIMEIVSGKISFSHKLSAVVLATSGCDKTNRTLPVGLKKLPHDPYISRKHYDHDLACLLSKGNIKEFSVSKLSKLELKTLMEFYYKAEIVLSKDTNEKTAEQVVDEKYLLSGNGNPRELLKSLVLQFS
ncbi:LAQU0S08e03708g1_1 [Lachancea quebecensis]|uniref:Small ribosomal subunit protein mS29 n=1 Tax=Lachancea quebecensis TaxID=1654605 RepID=A0A0P1KSJ0_9SACH|nr:LAQU0S08e03708g1_1 [Lachancea quebecensis]